MRAMQQSNPRHGSKKLCGGTCDKLNGPARPLIRDAIVQAAIEAGGGDMVAYLKQQAEKHPSAFLTLLGKVLPMQLTGVDGEVVKTHITFSIVDPKQR